MKCTCDERHAERRYRTIVKTVSGDHRLLLHGYRYRLIWFHGLTHLSHVKSYIYGIYMVHPNLIAIVRTYAMNVSRVYTSNDLYNAGFEVPFVHR